MTTEISLARTLVEFMCNGGPGPERKAFLEGRISVYVKTTEKPDGTKVVDAGFIHKNQDSTAFGHVDDDIASEGDYELYVNPKVQKETSEEADDAEAPEKDDVPVDVGNSEDYILARRV